MNLFKIKHHDKVRCSGSDACGMSDCRHFGKHRAMVGGYLHESCDSVAYCSVIGGFVRDRLAWSWLDEEECECDPNATFRRKKGL